MRVTDCSGVGARAVDEQMHGNFRRRAAATGDLAALPVGDHQILRLHAAFADSRGRGEDAPVGQADGEIAFRGDSEATLIKPAAGEAKLTPKFVLRLEGSRRDELRTHILVPRSGEQDAEASPLCAAKTRTLFGIRAMFTCNATAAGGMGAEAVPDYTANRHRKHVKLGYCFVGAPIASPCDVKVPGLLTGTPRQARSASLTSLKIVRLF